MIEHTPLDEAALSSDAQRALAPGPGKMMAARGMAPLANPVDLLSVLYQLSLDADAKICKPAKGSAQGLPENILVGGLGDASIDPRVVDFYAKEAKSGTKVMEVLILNQVTADETVAALAGRASQKEVDLIANNEQRILRHPEIIAAVYKNKSARMSTVDRIVELAVRNDVKVSGIAAWDELCRALHGESEEEKPSPELMDAIFSKAAQTISDDGEPIAEEKEAQQMSIRDMTTPMKIRLAMMGNKFERTQLIKDPKKLVAMAVIKSPGVKENEAAKYASNNSLCEDVIGYIASRREWTKAYNVKLSLVQNPKCPLPQAMRLLPHLRIKDARLIARSKSIPSALSTQARKLVAVRQGGGKK